jgi:hypothetical protein
MGNAGFPYLYNQIPGVAHTMEYPTFTEEMLECIDFIDSNTSGLGVSEWAGKSVSVFPNPISENQELVLVGLEGDVNISVFDASGKMIWNEQLINTSNRVTISDFRSGLSAGLYSVLIQSEEGRLTKKLVVR